MLHVSEAPSKYYEATCAIPSKTSVFHLRFIGLNLIYWSLYLCDCCSIIINLFFPFINQLNTLLALWDSKICRCPQTIPWELDKKGHLWMHWMYNILSLHVAVTRTDLLEKLNSHSQIIYSVILQILTAVSIERVGSQLLSCIIL